MARVSTKIGDVFAVALDGIGIKYFQLIAFDLTQLNSDVIRAFKEIYADNEAVELPKIVSGEVDFYAHCVTKSGIKRGVWTKVGHRPEVGDTTGILFRDTRDWGLKAGEKPILVSSNWYVWRINDARFTLVGRLEGEHRNSYMGLVVPPSGILEMLKGNKYPMSYPDFE